jgi:hypothetical protein
MIYKNKGYLCPFPNVTTIENTHELETLNSWLKK